MNVTNLFETSEVVPVHVCFSLDMSTPGVKGKTSMQIRPQEELEDPEKWLNNAMNFHGLQILSELPKDGNCLFHAVADQLRKRLGHRDHTHQSLRELAVKELEQRHVCYFYNDLDCELEQTFFWLLFRHVLKQKLKNVSALAGQQYKLF